MMDALVSGVAARALFLSGSEVSYITGVRLNPTNNADKYFVAMGYGRFYLVSI